jgi:hypothetical protein
MQIKRIRYLFPSQLCIYFYILGQPTDVILGRNMYNWRWNNFFFCVWLYFTDFIVRYTRVWGAWGSVVVKVLRYKSMGLGIDPRWFHWGFFPGASTVPCALGSTQPLKISTRETPGGEGGRCVRVTTLPPHSAERSRSLNLLKPQELLEACSGKPLPLHESP